MGFTDEAGVLKFDPEAMQQARAFTLQEVKVVTHSFARKLGEGSYGPVYYGRLPDGSEVAVKVNHKDSRQGTSEFINEVSLKLLVFTIDLYAGKMNALLGEDMNAVMVRVYN